METAELRAEINGQIESSQAATLFPLSLDGYWADKQGNEVSEIFFGEEIRYYLKHFPKNKYSLNITVSISVGSIQGQEEQLLESIFHVQPNSDEDICVLQIKMKDRWELSFGLKKVKGAIVKIHIGRFIYGVSEYVDSIGISEFKLENKFIIAGPKVKSTTALSQTAFSQNVHAIVLHRTDSDTVLSALNSASNMAAAHLYVDKNGDVYHKINFAQKAPHVGRIRKRSDTKTASTTEVFAEEKKKDYPERYPYNEDSIGIEVVGKSIDSSYYLAPTDIEQIKAVARLVNFLTEYFSLSKDDDIYGHEIISSKSKGDGQTIHDVIKPYLL